MTTHTPEPCQVNEDGTGDLFISGKGGRYITEMVSFHEDQRTEDQVMEDSRRIVACVNACAGIPTDVLQIGSKLIHDFEKVKQQRDELLYAADKVIAEWDKWKGFAGISDEDVAFEAAVVKLAAIAKARGQS